MRLRLKYPERTLYRFDSDSINRKDRSLEPLIISFGTDDPKYSSCLAQLNSDLELTGQLFDTTSITKGDSRFINRLKPSFIKIKLLSKKTTILWVDCDSRVKAPLYLPGGDWDVGTLALGPAHARSVAAADCIAFSPTNNTVKFLELWDFLCLLNRGGVSGHHEMLFALELMKGEISVIDIKQQMKGPFLRGKLGGEAVEIE